MRVGEKSRSLHLGEYEKKKRWNAVKDESH